MDGETLKAIRESRGETQAEFAKTLNSKFGKRYDKSKVSRWESCDEKIPAELAGNLLLDTLSFTGSGKTKVVAVVNQKGGVGKSTVCACLGYVLSRSGARVLLIDADSQANLTVNVGIDDDTIQAADANGGTFYHALARKSNINDNIIETGIDGLHIVPSSIQLAVAERELLESELRDGEHANLRFREVLSTVSGYDFVIVDCMPSLGILTLGAITAASVALIPAQTERFSVLGLGNLVETIIGVIPINMGLKVLGIVPTLYSPRNSQDRASLDDITSKAEEIGVPVFTPIVRSTSFAQAASANVVVYHGDPGAPGLDTFIEIARELGVTSIGG